MELSARKTADQVRQLTSEKDNMERDVAALKADNEKLRGANEKVVAEKWELSAANTDLTNRLQQSMAMSYMQVG